MSDVANSKPNGNGTKLSWYARYPLEFEDDTGHLTDSQYRAYCRLVDRYYRHGSLPADDAQLAHIVRKPIAAWKAIKPAVQAMFHDGWRDADVEKRLAEAQEKHAKRVAAGKLGGRPPEKPKPKQCFRNAKPTTTTTTEEGSASCSVGHKGRDSSVEGSAFQEEVDTYARESGHSGYTNGWQS